MKNWLIIIITIVVVAILAYLIVGQICKAIETNIAYTNPIIKYNKHTKTNSTIIINSKTDIHFDRADKFTLTPEGGYVIDNPVGIQLTNTSSSTSIGSVNTTENGLSKPDLSILKDKTYAIIGINVGYCVIFEPNIFTTQIPKINLENWRIGLFTDLIGQRISADYAHVNSFPDVLTLSTSVKIF